MYPKIKELIADFSVDNISDERKQILNPVVEFIKDKKKKNEAIRLNFICTHNSRRSHLSQIWAQTMATYFGVQNVNCYSGGTEATAMFPKVAETLEKQGFEILKLSESTNPVYAVKYAANAHAVICFSKTYDHSFNPKSDYAAVMTCNNADVGCPVVLGAEARFPVKFNDPKAYDGTELMDAKYAERSLEIAQELFYVFKNVI